MAVALNNGRCHTNGWAERRPNAAHRRCGSGTSSVIHSLAWPGPQGAAGSLPVGWTCCLFQVMCQRPLGWLQVRPQLSSALKGEDGDGISPPSCSWAIHVKKLQGLVNREMVWEELARASLWHCPDWLECPERDGPQGQKGTCHIHCLTCTSQYPYADWIDDLGFWDSRKSATFLTLPVTDPAQRSCWKLKMLHYVADTKKGDQIMVAVGSLSPQS